MNVSTADFFLPLVSESPPPQFFSISIAFEPYLYHNYPDETLQLAQLCVVKLTINTDYDINQMHSLVINEITRERNNLLSPFEKVPSSAAASCLYLFLRNCYLDLHSKYFPLLKKKSQISQMRILNLDLVFLQELEKFFHSSKP